MIDEEIPQADADEREADQLPIGNDAEEKSDYRRPRKLQLPSTDQSYFTIPEVVQEEEKEGAEAEPEEGQSAPLTWGRRRRAGRGRR
jgi:hypothetical protein